MYTWNERVCFYNMEVSSSQTKESFINLSSQLTDNVLSFRTQILFFVIVPKITISFNTYGHACLHRFYFLLYLMQEEWNLFLSNSICRITHLASILFCVLFSNLSFSPALCKRSPSSDAISIGFLFFCLLFCLFVFKSLLQCAVKNL